MALKAVRHQVFAGLLPFIQADCEHAGFFENDYDSVKNDIADNYAEWMNVMQTVYVFHFGHRFQAVLLMSVIVLASVFWLALDFFHNKLRRATAAPKQNKPDIRIVSQISSFDSKKLYSPSCQSSKTDTRN